MGLLAVVRVLRRAWAARSVPLPPWSAAGPIPSGARVVMTPQILATDDPLYAYAAEVARGLPLRMVLRDEWFGLALYADGATVQYTYLVKDGPRWEARGGGGGGNGPDLPLRAGVGSGWSAPSQPTAVMEVHVHGTCAPAIAQVKIEFDDGHVVDARVGNGVFGWFFARQPPSLRPPRHHLREILGAEPVLVTGLSVDGAEIARQELFTPGR